MAVRADLGYIKKMIVTALKAAGTPVVYVAGDEIPDTTTLWGELIKVSFNPQRRVSGTDQPDRGAVSGVVYVRMRPDRLSSDGSFALDQACGVIAARLDEYDLVDSGTGHRVEMDRFTCEVESDVGGGDNEIVHGMVTFEGQYSRSAGSDLQSYMSSDPSPATMEQAQTV